MWETGNSLQKNRRRKKEKKKGWGGGWIPTVTSHTHTSPSIHLSPDTHPLIQPTHPSTPLPIHTHTHTHPHILHPYTSIHPHTQPQDSIHMHMHRRLVPYIHKKSIHTPTKSIQYLFCRSHRTINVSKVVCRVRIPHWVEKYLFCRRSHRKYDVQITVFLLST